MRNLYIINFINKLDSHYRLYFSIALTVVAYFIIPPVVSYPVQFMLMWLVFAISNLILSWVTILTCHPLEVKEVARLQDSSRSLIFMFVLVASVIGLLAVILLLKSGKDLKGWELTFHVLLSVFSVMCSWWLVHTIFTFRYAHLYYKDAKDKDSEDPFAGGLDFPQGNEKNKEEEEDQDKPDYLDFVYFSFVLGMTFQVSDVEISSKRIRRLAWMHGVLSFGFNTIIVALTINVISGMVSGS